MAAGFAAFALAAAVMPAPAHAQGEQAPGRAIRGILENGDFEEALETRQIDEAGKPTSTKVVTAKGWTALIGPLPEVVTWGDNPKEMPKSGSRFLRVHDASDKEPVAIESARFPALPGAGYAAAVWLRSQDKGDPALYLNFYDEKGDKLQSKATQAAQPGPYPEWTYLSVEMGAPRNTATVSIVFYSFGRDVGKYDFDAAVLGQLGPAPAQLPQPPPAAAPPRALPVQPPRAEPVAVKEPLPQAAPQTRPGKAAAGEPEAAPSWDALPMSSTAAAALPPTPPPAQSAPPSAEPVAAPIPKPVVEVPDPVSAAAPLPEAAPAAPAAAQTAAGEPPAPAPKVQRKLSPPQKIPPLSERSQLLGPVSRGATEDEKEALGIQPIPQRPPNPEGRERPNKELPPPWILPKGEEKK